MLLVAAFATANAQLPAVSVTGSDGTWQIEPRSGKVDEHLGRRAIFVRGQSPPAFAAGVDFSDGAIEFDMASLPEGHFVGLVFRYADQFNHENIYFRLHRSGQFEAVQYAPRINGSGGTWQLYPEFMASALLPRNSWVHVRAEIRGSRLELFVGDSAKPLLVVPRLRGIPQRGRVGIWGRVNDKPEEWSAAITNVRIRPRASSPLAGVDSSALPPGTLTAWQIAGPYEAPDNSVALALPRDADWSPIQLEEHGLLNISRRLRKPPGGRHIVFLRNTVKSVPNESAALEIGYSDDIAVWLNGVLLYRGSNALGSRYPGFLGLVAPVENVELPLRAGDNELVVAVGERIAGWGFRGRVVRRNH
jgi:hypothetical protein